ncbi:MAG: YfiR family protein [Alphaproteobacteria bacterium]
MNRSWIFILLMVLAMSGGPAAGEVTLETAIKATYLYKFAPFVEWPAGPEGPFGLCVMGKDPFGDALDDAVYAEKINGRPIKVQRIKSASAAKGCHILYIGGDHRQVAAALNRLRSLPVLTVTDLPRDAQAKGVVNFVIVDNHVRFEIDDAAAAENGLVISSKLLRLSRGVRQRPTKQ